MSCLRKIIKLTAAFMLIGGFMVLLGTIGASDYADEVGEVFSYKQHIPLIITGVAMMAAGVKLLGSGDADE